MSFPDMASSSPSPTPQQARIWFRWMVSSLLGLIVIYVWLHYGNKTLQQAREEIIYLDAKEISTVNLLLSRPESFTEPAVPTLAEDSASLAQVRGKIMAYLKFRHEIREHSAQRLENDLAQFKTRPELQAILPDYPLRVKSFFWLADSWIYTEVLFWAIFGVIANLLYVVSEALRSTGTGFDRREVPSHWAKLAYTPFSVLIVYLAINQFGEQSLNNASFSAWQIVMAFVLGFFSGRTIELLNRLKDLLLPLNRDTAPTNSTTGATFSVHGQVRLKEGLPTSTTDLTLAAIKLISQTDARLNAIKHPEVDGTFLFDNLSMGDYQLVAELAADPLPLLASQPVTLDGQTPEPFVELVLEPDNAPVP